MSGAGNGVRTRDTKLGKLVLYQLSYARSDISYRRKQNNSQVIKSLHDFIRRGFAAFTNEILR
jgi:hypothetical protein